ncbi:hypothetical protein SASPL_111975 [Salvia splendens]|uniref:Uncharacterized protein n=1 Tax=Salvia splendens TaxID=180675 RepID=A0A8X8YDJ6_SALSN|nr:hypothetical protein SASPL_111975 [Salvia splendens]
MVTSSSSWVRALLQISPYTFSAIGIAISIGVSVLGAAWEIYITSESPYPSAFRFSAPPGISRTLGIYITGSSLIGAAIKSSRINSKNLIRFYFSNQSSFRFAITIHSLFRNMKSESSSDQIRRISRIVVANRRGVIMNDLVEIVNRVGV